MAVGHFGFNATTPHGSLLRSAMERVESGLADWIEIHGSMATMIDGDGSQAAHFTYMADKFGFTDTATAKGAYDELSSVLAKLTTDASVSNVKAALAQAFNKLR